MDNVRNIDREFSKEVRKAERDAANNACRICGKSKDSEWLQHAHIYTLSLHPKWERNGSSLRKWHDDNYVSSEANCIALCKTHHSKIDSKLGLQKVTVQYLESLKTNPHQCTALIGPVTGKWHRCQNKNTGAKGNGYRCAIHIKGGNEEILVEKTGGWNDRPKQLNNKPKNKSNKAKKKSKCSCFCM